MNFGTVLICLLLCKNLIYIFLWSFGYFSWFQWIWASSQQRRHLAALGRVGRGLDSDEKVWGPFPMLVLCRSVRQTSHFMLPLPTQEWCVPWQMRNCVQWFKLAVYFWRVGYIISWYRTVLKYVSTKHSVTIFNAMHANSYYILHNCFISLEHQFWQCVISFLFV